MFLNENEILADIKGYEGRYAISNFGRVYSYVSNKWLTPTANKHGNSIRYYVNLGRGSENRFYIHFLVANAFIPNPKGYSEIDHIDTNPGNNRVDNLRWVTHQQNMSNLITQKNLKSNTGLKCEIIDLETQKKYWGYAETCKNTGLSKTTIHKHCNNKVIKPRFQFTGRKLDSKRGTIF